MRLTDEEFTEWQIVFELEELHPQADRLRQAQLLAAIHTGERLQRIDKQPWVAAHFLTPDPWAPPPAKKPPPTPEQLKAQVAALNARKRGR